MNDITSSFNFHHLLCHSKVVVTNKRNNTQINQSGNQFIKCTMNVWSTKDLKLQEFIQLH